MSASRSRKHIARTFQAFAGIIILLILGVTNPAAQEETASKQETARGFDLKQTSPGTAPGAQMPDFISRATVSSGVMRDSILRTARIAAAGYGLVGGATIDKIAFRPTGWDALAASGALVRTHVTLDQAREALAGANTPPPRGDAPIIDLWAGLLDPPTIGRNLLGQHEYSRIMATLTPGQSALLVASRGLHSHRGTAWRITVWAWPRVFPSIRRWTTTASSPIRPTCPASSRCRPN